MSECEYLIKVLNGALFLCKTSPPKCEFYGKETVKIFGEREGIYRKCLMPNEHKKYKNEYYITDLYQC